MNIKPFIPAFLKNFYHLLWAWLAIIRFGFPDRKMTIIGVTGTDGKTSTCFFLFSILRAAGKKVGMITSIQTQINDQIWDNPGNTMPGRFYIREFLSKMLANGCQYAIIETSSEGLLQHRAYKISYDVAVLTNRSPEHLNTHKTMLNYRNAKGRLFAQLDEYHKTGIKKISIVFEEEKEKNYFLNFPAEEKYLFNADPKNRSLDISQIGQICPINLSVHGDFQYYNAAAAAAAAVSLGIDLDAIKAGLESVTFIPGRAEEIKNDRGFRVFIDYAVTPRAFETTLSWAKKLAGRNRLITVFGSAGSRDQTKRPILGEIAAKYADEIFLTSDDPRFEDPQQICEAIARGFPSSPSFPNHPHPSHKIIVDRTAAIRAALQSGQKDDVVLLLGLGHQHYMYIKDQKISFSEKQIVEKFLL